MKFAVFVFNVRTGQCVGRLRELFEDGEKAVEVAHHHNTTNLRGDLWKFVALAL